LNGTLDEVCVMPRLVSADEVRTWANMEAVFFDQEEQIDAGSRPIRAPGVIIDSSGAWGIADGVKQAGFGTDGKWMAGGGSVVAGENGLKIISPNGDYSLMNWDQLRFFKTGFPNIPFWYSKRIAYGIAESGQYVDLAGETGVPWDHTPKVITSVTNLRSYTAQYADFNQHYESFADAITPNGFYVYGRAVIPGTKTRHTVNETKNLTGFDTQYWYSPYSNPGTNTIRIHVSVNQTYRAGFWLNYHKKNQSVVRYYTREFSAGQWTGTFTITGLPLGEYRFYIEMVTDGTGQSLSATIHWWEEEFGGEVLYEGDVAWIAIEGGAD